MTIVMTPNGRPAKERDDEPYDVGGALVRTALRRRGLGPRQLHSYAVRLVPVGEIPMNTPIYMKFDFGQRVVIDNDRSLVGFVTAVTVRQTREPLYGVSYVHNGDAKEAWIEEWRLES